MLREAKEKDIIVVFQLKKVKSVLFSHRAHVVRRNVPCDICHKSLLPSYREKAEKEGKSFFQVLDKNFCGKCHSGKLTFSVKDKKYCGRCHTGWGGEKK